MNTNKFEERLKESKIAVHPVVPFTKTDKLLRLDFTANNTALTPDILANTVLFTEYVEEQLRKAGATYGIGGYGEHRTIYSRSVVFDTAAPSGSLEGRGIKEQPDLSSPPEAEQGPEARRLHLGVDIWGPVDTPVYAPLPGTVHSFAFNNAYGDYGATLILQHELNGLLFHTLYGHLSLKSIQDKHIGQEIQKGEWIASFGDLSENGNWPPHLHLQVILNMQGVEGDYPGVCKFSEKEEYLINCPDPDLIIDMMKHAI